MPPPFFIGYIRLTGHLRQLACLLIKAGFLLHPLGDNGRTLALGSSD